jgi:hypothetical protein
VYPSIQEVRGHDLAAALTTPGPVQAGDQPSFTGERVLEVNVDLLTSKTGVPIQDISIKRRSENEATILDDIVTWTILAGPKEGEPFLTRHSLTVWGIPTTKAVLQKEVTAAIKRGAERLGLDHRLFSDRSLRKTAITEMKKGGLSKKEIHARTGHKKNSSISDTHYNYSDNGSRGENRGPASLEGASFTIADLTRVTSGASVQATREKGGAVTSTTSTEEEEKGEKTTSKEERKRRYKRKERAAQDPAATKGQTKRPITNRAVIESGHATRSKSKPPC